MNFWSSLDTTEREAFLSVADERTFAGGARLMREGEPANHVVVILSGWTRVCVHENGRERMLAGLGPGQLVGERGALQVNVRSATVIALETVRALVMKTADFASFVSVHPRVLDILDDQVYDRLTGEPAGLAHDDRPDILGPGHASRSPAARPRQHPQLLNGENCTILLTDVVGFGARSRTDEDRRIIRQASMGMTRTALEPLWEACAWEDRGDGLLIVVPPRIPTVRVMECLHQGLPGKLRRHNRIYRDPVRIQLRVAVNVGPVTSDGIGVSGEAIILTARLLDAPILKKAIASTAANLGIMASAFVYETAIRQGESGVDPAQYELVQVSVKETRRVPAWMQLIDTTPPAPPVRGPLEAGTTSRSVPRIGCLTHQG